MKKSIAILLIIMMFSVCSAFAMNVKLDPEKLDLPEVGETFQINVVIEDAEDVGGFEFDILYDPDIVEIAAQEDAVRALVGDDLHSRRATGGLRRLRQRR